MSDSEDPNFPKKGDDAVSDNLENDKMVEKDSDVENDSTSVEKDDSFEKAVQEKVNKIISERVRRESEKLTRLQAEFDKLSDGAKSSLEKIGELESALASAENRAVKFQLAAEEGVSVAFVESLRGNTIEELKESLKAVRESQPKQNLAFSGREYSSQNNTVFESDIEALKNVRF